LKKFVHFINFFRQNPSELATKSSADEWTSQSIDEHNLRPPNKAYT